MKKGLLRFAVVVALALFLSVGSAFAADEGKNFITNKVGVGYQGMVAGSFLNGLSARGWIGDRIGLEGSLFYGSVDADIDDSDALDADLWMLEFKFMYAVLVKDFSKFYVGGKLGYGQVNATTGDTDVLDGESVFAPGVFVGAEWSFPQLPEVGFNFDVGYSALIFNNEVGPDDDLDVELDIQGISATFGIHYYF